jgi:class 3 adenylate cyclase
MAGPPTGTIAFLFTDIEGSTGLWERDAIAMQSALARHDAILHRVIEEQEGYVFKTVGDAFCAAFSTATDALTAALEAQRALFTEEWGVEGGVRVRMGLHTVRPRSAMATTSVPPSTAWRGCSRPVTAGRCSYR